MQDFILHTPRVDQGVKGYNPYVFDEKTMNGPSEFEAEILIDDYIYRYSFQINGKSVLREKLVRILTNREQSLFVREGKKKFELDEAYQGVDSQRLQFVFQGTQENELFLSNTVDQNVESFKPIYNWFARQLIIIGPTTQLISQTDTVFRECSQYMKLLDTSVKSLEFIEVSRNYIRADVFEDISKSLAIDAPFIIEHNAGERYLLHKKIDGTISVKLLFSIHEGNDGKDYQINFSEESDGTKRLFDLLPAFVAHNKNATIIVDEVDRSLHSLVTKQLFSFFLGKSKLCFNQQIIATTHDLQLMTQELFRRDEMWVFERKENGTELIPLSDFEDIRYDKDIRKSYLEGRMGGIPHVMLPLPDTDDCV
ncbi:MAG: ATP-binding protein, partial [Lentisphaerae bacterium]|nr:ATP-binding protein [Lentisphaerota bacterium]